MCPTGFLVRPNLTLTLLPAFSRRRMRLKLGLCHARFAGADRLLPMLESI